MNRLEPIPSKFARRVYAAAWFLGSLIPLAFGIILVLGLAANRGIPGIVRGLALLALCGAGVYFTLRQGVLAMRGQYAPDETDVPP